MGIEYRIEGDSMLIFTLLCTGVAVYFITLMIVEKQMHQRSFEARTLNEIERMGDRRDRLSTQKNSLIKKLLLTLSDKIAAKIKLAEAQRQWLRQDLQQQGLRLKPEEYVAQMIIALVGGLALGLYISATMGVFLPLALLGGGYAGFTVYRFYTGKRKRERVQAIADQFPDVLDLLATSVSAGLGFTQAMQYVAEQYQGPLTDEFVAVQRAISLGSTRRAALMEMAERVGLQEMRTFVGALVQADELGISLGNILNAQAKEVRQINRLKKEEKAQKVAVKMLLPMVLFILPALFIVLLAPAAAQALQAFSGGLV